MTELEVSTIGVVELTRGGSKGTDSLRSSFPLRKGSRPGDRPSAAPVCSNLAVVRAIALTWELGCYEPWGLLCPPCA